ncbi:hypothetical protein HYH02_001420 [Chlamydomonas schloesseri]|uniref:Cleavage/polyadenylation specificity factor A subunit N-terminal domain-containing protein n=1 Tax=Chlamydomonas schloesseri TaxID=2026947 RepID=A0A835WVX3_9CHLO|nr:hypothetical protein HYH02_001420 [Chlamydomonas schloesseri]|eukprot:KAG2454397.1 hypothetical protein HYH02_001420 [Chlamydomonas schloesseri]
MVFTHTLKAKLLTSQPGSQPHTFAVPVPAVSAVAYRPGQPGQVLLSTSFGVVPLRLPPPGEELAKAAEPPRVEPPIPLRNVQHSGFDHQRIFDASFDPLSGFVLLACGHSLYGIDEANRVDCLAGDPYAEDGALLVDGPAVHARFVGAQRLAAAGGGLTFIRDRCSSSRNGFTLRALHELPRPEDQGGGGSGLRAVTTVHLGAAGDVGPHTFAYCPRRKSLVYATRGRALHQLLPHGVTRQLAGNDEPLASVAAANSAAAAASANDSASDDPDSAVSAAPVEGPSGAGRGGSGSGAGRVGADEPRYGLGAGGGMDAGVNPCLMWPGACSFMPFTNIQAVATDPDGSGDIYVLDGVSGSSTTLKVLRGDGQLDTLAVGLRIGPKGSGRWPRLAALPGRRLIVYGVSQHDLMILQL